jgi:hypothetical protein
MNGYTQSVEPLTSFAGCLLFGVLYFAYKGVWKHALIAFFAAFMTLGISWVIYPFFAYKCVTGSYLERGWQRVGRGAPSVARRRQPGPSFDNIQI